MVCEDVFSGTSHRLSIRWRSREFGGGVNTLNSLTFDLLNITTNYSTVSSSLSPSKSLISVSGESAGKAEIKL